MWEFVSCADECDKSPHCQGQLNFFNLTIDLHVSALFKRGTRVDEIAKTLAEGIAIDHSNPELHQTHHELLMPKFDHLTETERRSIALYVISLFTDVDHGRSQP